LLDYPDKRIPKQNCAIFRIISILSGKLKLFLRRR
jgi:hypothetical protein